MVTEKVMVRNCPLRCKGAGSMSLLSFGLFCACYIRVCLLLLISHCWCFLFRVDSDAHLLNNSWTSHSQNTTLCNKVVLKGNYTLSNNLHVLIWRGLKCISWFWKEFKCTETFSEPKLFYVSAFSHQKDGICRYVNAWSAVDVDCIQTCYEIWGLFHIHRQGAPRRKKRQENRCNQLWIGRQRN